MKTNQPTSSCQVGASFIDINPILQQVLRQIGLYHKADVVLRCDALPHWQISQQAAEEFFRLLLERIYAVKQSNQKLYIHIHCNAPEHNLSPVSLAQPAAITIATNAGLVVETDEDAEAIAAPIKHAGGIINFSAGGIITVSMPGKFSN